MSRVSIIDEDGQVVLRLMGDIDASEVDAVNSQILGAVHNDAHGIVVDLSKVTYLDSAGIQMLFDLIRRFHAARQGVAVAVPGDSPLATLLKITHVHEACPVAASIAECIEALGIDSKLY